VPTAMTFRPDGLADIELGPVVQERGYFGRPLSSEVIDAISARSSDETRWHGMGLS
jgi:hypothetical protein